MFWDAEYGSVTNLQANDTIVLASQGVVQNLSDARLMALVGDAYEQFNDPQTLADQIISEAKSANALSPAAIEDITCIVSYVQGESSTPCRW